MKRFALLLLLAACAQPKPTPAAPLAPPPPVKEPAHAPESRTPVFVEYIKVERAWVTKYVPDGDDDVKVWARAVKLDDSFWHILIRVESRAPADDAKAKKKAEALLDRVKKGEDFAKLAKASSEDPGSRERGGEYAADNVKGLLPGILTAWNGLKSGETAPALVKTSSGYHVVRKAKPSDETLQSAYRRAKSAELTKKLGLALSARFRKAPNARAAISDAVQAVLGDDAVADPDRPTVIVVDRDRVKDIKHLSAASKGALSQFADGAHPGDVLDPPAADEEMVIVAQAVPSPL